jgi:uncharacterized protein YcaQ
MTKAHRLSPTEARRIAVRAQLLEARRKAASAAVHREIKDLARWLQLDLVRLDGSRP